jgi:GTP cyclohydrolase I
MPVDRDRVHALVHDLLLALGRDPTDPAIADTPRRVADLWVEFLDYDPGTIGTTFEASSTDQMVVVSGIRVWSMCEHHLLPFWADVAIGYVAAGRVIGLSKLGRIAHQHAHALQLQERLVEQIATTVANVTGSADVAVVAQGEHLCMTMRGIRTPHRMTSSAMHGVFRDEPPARSEFLRLAGI